MKNPNLYKSLLLTIITTLLPQLASAYDFMVDGLCYNYNSDGNSVTVTSSPSYSNLSGDLNIPASVTYSGKSYSVTSIGNSAFLECTGLTSVTIGNSVTSIGSGAFLFCSGLTSITIPNSVTSIGNSAFDYCSGLSKVTWNVKSCADFSQSDYSPFNGCSNIKIFIFGEEVERIPNYLCFYMSLTSVTIPNSVTSIGKCAFFGCGLTSVTIPNSVTSIGNSAFEECIVLTSVTIGNSVTSIGEKVFSACGGLTSVTIGNSVTSIGQGAFNGCSGLTSITIPNSVTTIGISAFQGCTGLTSVTIPNSVTSIGGSAFCGCTGLTSVTIGNSVTSIGQGAFGYCSSLTSINSLIENPNNVTLGSNIFLYVNKSTCILTVPSASVNLYMNADQWKDFLVIRAVTTSIDLSNSQLSLFCNQNYTLSATVYPSNAYSVINWFSSDTNAATVDQNGLVTAKALGTSTITAIATDGSGVSSSCLVTVTRITNIMLNKSATSIYVGGTETLTATITPSSDVINNTLIWSSSNTSVATVDQNGLVTAKKLGTATITAEATDGYGVNASCDVTVTGVESISLNKNDATMYIGDSETLIATILPSDVINNTLTWSSSKTSVATVNQSGLVTAKARGTATITAAATDGSGVSASCVVNVIPEYTLAMDTMVHIRGTERVPRTIDINLDNRNAISGVQFDMTLPDYVVFATVDGYLDMWLDDTRKARNHSVDINLIGTKKYRVVVSSPTNKTFKGNEGAILHFNVLIDKYPSTTSPGTIKLSDIVLAEPDETQHTISSVTSDVKFVYLVGDASADVIVDVADYVLTANKIMQRPVTNFWSDAANANYNDNILNVTDLVAITNIALEIRGKEVRPSIEGFQLSPAVTIPGSAFPLYAQVTQAGADRTVVTIAVDNDEAIAAMQFDINLPDGVTLESAETTERSQVLSATCGISPEGLARVMLSSFGTSSIGSGSGDVLALTLRGKAHNGELMQLTNAMMTERNLIEHGATSDLTLDLNDITGVSTVVYEHVNIYGANGSIVIESPLNGMAQLVRINGMSQKVEVKLGRNEYPVSVTHGDVIIVSFNGTVKKIHF